jgi:hypothetical protein
MLYEEKNFNIDLSLINRVDLKLKAVSEVRFSNSSPKTTFWVNSEQLVKFQQDNNVKLWQHGVGGIPRHIS